MPTTQPRCSRLAEEILNVLQICGFTSLIAFWNMRKRKNVKAVLIYRRSDIGRTKKDGGYKNMNFFSFVAVCFGPDA
jgi:hypothetical protein